MNSTWTKVLKYHKNQKIPKDDYVTFYAYEVATKKILTSKSVYNACLRHLLFFYKWKKDPSFKYQFDIKALHRLIKFSENIIIPQTNKRFVFPLFRKFMGGFVFGWVHKNNPNKLMTTQIFDVEARKQWKSSFWAMVLLAISLGYTNDNYTEIYISGPQRATSRVPYKIMCDYLYKSPSINKFFSAYNSIHIKSKNGGVIQHLSFEKSALEGKNPSVVMLTEYHLHESDALQESALTSFNLSRDNQLIIYDTTKGHNINSVCYEREKAYKKYLQDQIDNPDSMLPNEDIFLWAAELDYDDYSDWENPDLWIKANPNLGVSVSLEQLKAEFDKINNNASEVEFQIKRLGMWVGTATAHFSLSSILDSDETTKPSVHAFLSTNGMSRQNTSSMGVDLSSIYDTTSLVMCFEIPDIVNGGEPIWYFTGKIYTPEHGISKKEIHDRAQYNDWSRDGYCTIIPGEIINYEYLMSDMKRYKKEMNVTKCGYDPWSFNIVKQHMINTKVFMEEDLVKVPQGVKLTPIFKEFERKLIARKIAFNGNPVLINHILNVNVKETTSSTETIIIKKISSTSRIDAFMASLIAASLRLDLPKHTTISMIPLYN